MKIDIMSYETALLDGELISGDFKSNKARLVQAWIEIHRDELMADW